MHVVAGGIELNTFEDEEQTRNLQKIIGHPNYDSNTISNDICLLHLQESLQFNDWVQPIGLPTQGQEYEAGTECTVTGWGTTSVCYLQSIRLSLLSDILVSRKEDLFYQTSSIKSMFQLCLMRNVMCKYQL